MSEDVYDGVVIGSGQHGLILGSYLARQGLKIAVLERRLIYGGGPGGDDPRLLPSAAFA
jgi:phytoene dehydrogenase-like protein